MIRYQIRTYEYSHNDATEKSLVIEEFTTMSEAVNRVKELSNYRVGYNSVIETILVIDCVSVVKQESYVFKTIPPKTL